MRAALSVRELTAGGRGAIRVLELAGAGALEGLRRLVPGRRLDPGEFAPVVLRDRGGALLDEAIVWIASPERVELHLHGAPVLVERVRAELGLESSAEEAPRTIEERAEALLARAESDAAARMLLDQAEGALRGELKALLASADDDLVAGARRLARRGRIAGWLVVPPRVVLAGPVNAGKSTLFNLLVGRERVVVDAAPGTTRDAVRERVRLGAYAVDLFDTAGERALAPGVPGSAVERAGQALSAELQGAADLVLFLVPPGRAVPRALPPRTRVVHSLADLDPTPSRRAYPSLSARNDPEQARARVEELLHAALELSRAPWEPGAGVPFERAWTERLAAEDAAALRRSVAAWLAGRGPD